MFWPEAIKCQQSQCQWPPIGAACTTAVESDSQGRKAVHVSSSRYEEEKSREMVRIIATSDSWGWEASCGEVKWAVSKENSILRLGVEEGGGLSFTNAFFCMCEKRHCKGYKTGLSLSVCEKYCREWRWEVVLPLPFVCSDLFKFAHGLSTCKANASKSYPET